MDPVLDPVKRGLDPKSSYMSQNPVKFTSLLHLLSSISLITLKGVYAVWNTFLYLRVYLISIALEIKFRYNESYVAISSGG